MYQNLIIYTIDTKILDTMKTMRCKLNTIKINQWNAKKKKNHVVKGLP
jgi:hypothetical protein